MLLAREQSPEFARQRLASPVHQPVPLGGDRWLVFQEIAGASLADMGVLTTLLDRARTATEPKGEPGFAEATTWILRETLAQWTGRPNFQKITAAQFVRIQLADRYAPGKPLYEMGRAMIGPTVRVAGEPADLPNPFALLKGRLPAGRREVRALIGKAHGDLHTENILIPLRGGADPSGFRLIDLARYAPDAPLSRDPTHLSLYIVNRALADSSSDIARDALIDVLLGTRPAAAELLPGWLIHVLAGIDDVTLQWSGALVDEWREQRLGSLLACALMFLGRASTRPADREWFLRLAARATALFALSEAPSAAATGATAATTMPGVHALTNSMMVGAAASTGSGPSSPDVPANDGGWIDALCRRLPQLRDAALVRGVSEQLESVIALARIGGDGHNAFVRLLRELGEGDQDVRVGVPGLGGGRALFAEYYVCPVPRCPRLELRKTAKGTPRCHLANTAMQLREW
jgi:hypothetical protein